MEGHPARISMAVGLKWRVLVCAFCILVGLGFFQNATPPFMGGGVFAQEIREGWKAAVEKLRTESHLKPDELVIVVSISEQKLYLIKGEEIVKTYLVSTSRYGIGSKAGSNKTPPGTHRIAEKIGGGAPIGMIFEYGIRTERIAPIHNDTTDVEEDLITTRILWL